MSFWKYFIMNLIIFTVTTESKKTEDILDLELSKIETDLIIKWLNQKTSGGTDISKALLDVKDVDKDFTYTLFNHDVPHELDNLKTILDLKDVIDLETTFDVEGLYRTSDEDILNYLSKVPLIEGSDIETLVESFYHKPGIEIDKDLFLLDHKDSDGFEDILELLLKKDSALSFPSDEDLIEEPIKIDILENLPLRDIDINDSVLKFLFKKREEFTKNKVLFETSKSLIETKVPAIIYDEVDHIPKELLNIFLKGHSVEKHPETSPGKTIETDTFLEKLRRLLKGVEHVKERQEIMKQTNQFMFLKNLEHQHKLKHCSRESTCPEPSCVICENNCLSAQDYVRTLPSSYSTDNSDTYFGQRLEIETKEHEDKINDRREENGKENGLKAQNNLGYYDYVYATDKGEEEYFENNYNSRYFDYGNDDAIYRQDGISLKNFNKVIEDYFQERYGSAEFAEQYI